MRILQLHCDNISYEPTKKEIQSAEEIDPKPVSIDEVVVCFVAVEKDDTEDVAKDAISQIKESMKKIGCSKLLLYPYAHLSSDLSAPSTALSLLKLMESECTELTQDECTESEFCEWSVVTTPNGEFEMCHMYVNKFFFFKLYISQIFSKFYSI